VSAEILFKADAISKSYPGTVALQKVSMEIHAGQVVGLVGENGAGKSTLLRIIAGVELPSSGTMEMRAQPYAPRNPREANALGVGMVFQEQSLITTLTVGQNIYFGQERRFSRLRFVNWRRMYREAARVLEEIDIHDIKPDRKVLELDFARRQMVEVAKVLNNAKGSGHARTLILLDEPTSVLSETEIKQLFKEINRLREAGNAIVFVSHRLEEVVSISDRVYVFKDGCNVGAMDRAEVNEMRLYELMVGRKSSGEYYKLSRQAVPEEKVVLEAQGLSLRGSFKDVSFRLHQGEVLGICGVVGSGKEEVCAVISGDEQHTAGRLTVNGRPTVFHSPNQALRAGILSIPKERREEGIVGILSVYENISLSNLDVFKKNGLISRKAQRAKSQEWIRTLAIKCSGDAEAVNQLSGGNAQKVVFARILVSGSKILVLNHPTRGVDVGAKEEIYTLVREITAAGKSIILLGDTLDECIGLSNRILVMKDGVVTQEFQAPPENKPAELDIVKHMM
jgi:ribose transport system ATP-binding protein